jgi:hypothetical protein
MMYYTQHTDEQLRQQVLEYYRQHIRIYPIPEAIQAMKSELYPRGYGSSDMIKLALEALVRLQRQAN